MTHATLTQPRTAFALKSQRVLRGGANVMGPAIIVIENGMIADILDYDATLPPGLPVEDFGDKVILPGLVDSHVHINEPGRTEWEGFNTATQAAAAGGITTVVDMPLNCSPVTTSAAALKIKLDSLENKLWIDCGFWGGVVPDSLDDLEELIHAGVLGVKSFTIHSGLDEFPSVEVQHLRHAIAILSNYDLPYLIHAELDESENEDLPAIGDSYGSFLASRPKSWENNAIKLMIALLLEAKQQGASARVHIVHLSSAEAIEDLRAAKEQGLKISAETCPHYLTLFAEAIPDGKTLFKCCPPIREEENRQQLWQGLADGIIEFIVSDHSPCTPSLKHIETGDLENAWGGISSLQFGLSIIWTEAKQRDISLEKVVNWMATEPAKFAGLGKQKGQLKVGFHADLVIFDPEAKYTIDKDLIKYRHKITPYEGREVTGLVEQTYLRGQRIYASGEIIGKPIGQALLTINLKNEQNVSRK